MYSGILAGGMTLLEKRWRNQTSLKEPFNRRSSQAVPKFARKSFTAEVVEHDP
jgi:hypothetical protein